MSSERQVHQMGRKSMPTYRDFVESVPLGGKFRRIWSGQDEMLRFVGESILPSGELTAVIQSPTGSGKTLVEVTILEAVNKKQGGSCFLIAPNKTIVQQISRDFPNLKVAYGRNDHPCLYYVPDKDSLRTDGRGILREDALLPLLRDPDHPKADEIPCLSLDCPHRVDTETGETYGEGAARCPYYQGLYEAQQGGVVLCTMSFYLFTQLFGRLFGTPGALVIDEAHRIADVVRSSLTYEITDWHLLKSIELLERVNSTEVETLKKFLGVMRRICRRKPPGVETPLTDNEVRRLIDVLVDVDSNALLQHIREAIRANLLDPLVDRITLRKLELLGHDLRRYVHAFEYSLATDERKPLNYTCAFYVAEKGEHQHIQYKLVIKNWYVAPLVRKILPPLTVALSATIGDEDIFGYDTGIRGEFLELGSGFPAENTRLYMPTDVPNLAMNTRRRQDLTRTLRKIAKACKRFTELGHRSLVVVISNAERGKFLMLAAEEGVNAVSYGNGITPKMAAQIFKDGQGDVLVGTAANYAEGLDLPKMIAPIIFFLRPGYARPNDAAALFEEKRCGRGQAWALRHWRMAIQALQVRGRNVRGVRDLGVTFFMSQNFRRIVFPSLPGWLSNAYRGELSFEDCLADAKALLR